VNVLIRNVTSHTKWNEVVGILDLLTTNTEFIGKIERMKEITFDDKRLKLTQPIRVLKQDNGNLCVEFLEEEK